MNENIRTEDDYTQVVETYSDLVYRLALARTKNQAAAEDIYQEVFLRYLKNQDKIVNETHKKAWLIRTTINCSKSLLTSAWFRSTVALEDNLSFTTPEETGVYHAVMGLPQKYRTVIHLFYYEDLSIREISEILGIGENTIKSQLSRARTLLKEKLKGEYDYV